MEKDNGKIITMAFLAAAVVASIVARVILESLAAQFGVVARFYGQDWATHGLPVAVGLVTFSILRMKSSINRWADEAIMEVRKVVWPSRKDTLAMTIVCCVMLLISGIVLGTFDILSTSLVKMLVN